MCIRDRFGTTTTTIAVSAACKNDLEFLQWAHSKGSAIDCHVVRYAARNGNLAMLKWLHGIVAPSQLQAEDRHPANHCDGPKGTILDNALASNSAECISYLQN